jgi:phytoene dehydrogenase-like protein
MYTSMLKKLVVLWCIVTICNATVETTKNNNKDATSRVAIIGAGIGGASCAYYTNKFAPSSQIDVFEQNSIAGGRLKHVTFGGEVIEVGGDAWSSVCYFSCLFHFVEEVHC